MLHVTIFILITFQLNVQVSNPLGILLCPTGKGMHGCLNIGLQPMRRIYNMKCTGSNTYRCNQDVLLLHHQCYAMDWLSIRFISK